MTLFVASGIAWGADDLLKQSQVMFKPIPPSAPALKGNKQTPAKLLLGKMLYFDPRLSSSNLISCNTCHNVGLGGGDLQETSVGHGWQKGPRNAPTVLNAVFNVAQFWDGRAKDLMEQAKGPVQASVEMNNKPERVVETLKSIPEYVALFTKAFPDQKDPLTFDNMAKAIEVFEATLLTPDAPFDRYLKGDRKALGAREQEGLRLFIDKGCGACHNGVNVGGGGYFPFGLVEKPAGEIRPVADTGRFKVTHTASDEYVFRSPPLRNINLTPPYFHSGKVWKLDEAVAIMGSSQLGIKLNDDEVGKIVAFLGTLTGRQPKVEYPILPPNGPTTPRPLLQ
ncbi:cytochrome-c peroxidase [Geobacter sp. AOG1]|uniref:cytochrome-c peroxidase n=1 Tax=Geobacter sp. AOG1 TaxID=1566346 RepID=UPI0035A73BC7